MSEKDESFHLTYNKLDSTSGCGFYPSYYTYSYPYSRGGFGLRSMYLYNADERVWS
jgi:hypothetical protein